MVFLFVFFWLLLVCLAGWGSSQDRNERLEIGHCSQVTNQSEDQFATQGKVKCSVCKTNKSRTENYIFHEMLHECFSKSGTPKAIHTIWFDDDDDDDLIVLNQAVNDLDSVQSQNLGFTCVIWLLFLTPRILATLATHNTTVV